MTVEEIPVAFPCEGAALVGVVHAPARPRRRGVLAIVAGGPQYRGGCCRQLVMMARQLAAQGTPVMRFDYRGLGDGGGPYRGFEHIGPDLDAAIDTFLRTVPGLEEVVLWGGCDAAAAALIHGPARPRVAGLILGNPWVHAEDTHARVVVRHYYLRRIREKAFWLKLLRGRLNPFSKLKSVLRATRQARGEGGAAPDEADFRVRMLRGLEGFSGRVLLLMSGLSLVSKEFDALVAANPAWKQAVAQADVTRVDFPKADQAFSTIEARNAMIAASADWLQQWPDGASCEGGAAADARKD